MASDKTKKALKVVAIAALAAAVVGGAVWLIVALKKRKAKSEAGDGSSAGSTPPPPPTDDGKKESAQTPPPPAPAPPAACGSTSTVVYDKEFAPLNGSEESATSMNEDAARVLAGMRSSFFEPMGTVDSQNNKVTTRQGLLFAAMYDVAATQTENNDMLKYRARKIGAYTDLRPLPDVGKRGQIVDQMMFGKSDAVILASDVEHVENLRRRSQALLDSVKA